MNFDKNTCQKTDVKKNELEKKLVWKMSEKWTSKKKIERKHACMVVQKKFKKKYMWHVTCMPTCWNEK